MKKTIFGAVVFLLIGVGFLSTSSAENTIKKWEQSKDDAQLLQVISDNSKLKDPSSVQLKKVSVSTSTNPDDSITTEWCGLINAKNSYGAYVGFKRFFVMSSKKGNIVDIENKKNGGFFLDDLCKGSSIDTTTTL